MEIEFIQYSSIAEVQIKSGSATINEDVSKYIGGAWIVPIATVERFITIANEMSRFNREDDVEFVKKIYDTFLNDSERERFLDLCINKK
jgi:hypothetical protein